MLIDHFGWPKSENAMNTFQMYIISKMCHFYITIENAKTLKLILGQTRWDMIKILLRTFLA